MLPAEAAKDHNFVLVRDRLFDNDSNVFSCKKCNLRCIHYNVTDSGLFRCINSIRPATKERPWYYVMKGEFYGNDNVLSCEEMMIKDIIE